MKIKNALICYLAGKSSRMGEPKQHIKIHGKTFLEHICDSVSSLCGKFSGLIFVGSPSDEPSENLINSMGGKWVKNFDIDLGPLHSIRLGCAQIPDEEGFLLWPVDHPLIQPDTISEILRKGEEYPDAIIIPTHKGKRGHPSRFPGWTKEILRESPLEAGARWVLQKFPDRIKHVEMEDFWVTMNLNSPEKLLQARSKF